MNSQASGKRGKNVGKRMREYVEKNDRIAPLKILAMEWGARETTCYRDLNDLEREGYVFAFAEPDYHGPKTAYDGARIITRRPPVQEVPPPVVVTPIVSEQPELILVAPGHENGTDKAISEKLDTIIELLKVMGPMYGTMKKLANAWNAGV